MGAAPARSRSPGKPAARGGRDAAQRLIDEHRRAASDVRALARGQAHIDRHGDRAEQQAGVQRLGKREPAG